jgi:hypothetical protein
MMEIHEIIQKLEWCIQITEQQRQINPIRIMRLEFELCKYASMRNLSLFKSAIELCSKDQDENICLIGAASLLMQQKN